MTANGAGDAGGPHPDQELQACRRRLQDLGGELEREADRRRRLEQRLDEILSVVSHQLRTPLASLLGFSELLLDREYPPERQRHLIEVVHGETRRLTDLLGDFVDLQALESGRVAYDFGPVEVSELLGEVAQRFADGVYGTSLRLEVADSLPPVRADRDRLQQVLHHLVANAVAYSPAATGVRLAARREDGRVLLSVVDRGVGVPEDDRERIFERFVRAGNVPGETTGAGLGLAIVRRIVDDHRGKIRLESKVGAGSTFSVALPLA